MRHRAGPGSAITNSRPSRVIPRPGGRRRAAGPACDPSRTPPGRPAAARSASPIWSFSAGRISAHRDAVTTTWTPYESPWAARAVIDASSASNSWRSVAQPSITRNTSPYGSSWSPRSSPEPRRDSLSRRERLQLHVPYAGRVRRPAGRDRPDVRQRSQRRERYRHRSRGNRSGHLRGMALRPTRTISVCNVVDLPDRGPPTTATLPAAPRQLRDQQLPALLVRTVHQADRHREWSVSPAPAAALCRAWASRPAAAATLGARPLRDPRVDRGRSRAQLGAAECALRLLLGFADDSPHGRRGEQPWRPALPPAGKNARAALS